MKTQIKRRCACGCGEVTNYGKKYVNGHNKPFKGKHHTEETKLKLSLTNEGQVPWAKGREFSKEHKLKMSLTKLKKSHPDDEYCEAWRDREYTKDLLKGYCENKECKNNYKRLNNHHINLNKKDCRPSNVMTLCVPCHTTLHHILQQVNKHSILTINRSDHITYIHKRTKRIIVTIIKKSNPKNVL